MEDKAEVIEDLSSHVFSVRSRKKTYIPLMSVSKEEFEECHRSFADIDSEECWELLDTSEESFSEAAIEAEEEDDSDPNILDLNKSSSSVLTDFLAQYSRGNELDEPGQGPTSSSFVALNMGNVADPTESEIAELPEESTEQFSEFLERLYAMADPNLTGLRYELSEAEDENEPLSSDSERDCIRGTTEEEDASGWEAISRQPDPWAEARHPTAPFLGLEKLATGNSYPGELSIKQVAAGIGNLALPPGQKRYACTKLQLPNMGIKSIEYLSKYCFLQYVDLMSNEIQDLSPIWEIPYLVVLDASRNQISLEGFGRPTVPLFMTYLNLAHNRLTGVPQLGDLWALKHLNLSCNQITTITNLENLEFLQYLNLSGNQIAIVENINNEYLKELVLSHNNIKEWSQDITPVLNRLEILLISYNELQTVEDLKGLISLWKLDISYNNLHRMTEIHHIKEMSSLRELYFIGNDLDTFVAHSRKLIIFSNPHIKTLNGITICPRERAKAVRLYGMNQIDEIRHRDAAKFYRSHCCNLFSGTEKELQIGYHPAVIILVGFIGCNIPQIIKECQMKNPRKVKIVRQTTTEVKRRSSLPSIVAQQIMQKHVSSRKFYQLEKAGSFVYTYSNLGYKYGIEVSEMDAPDSVLLLWMSCPAALELLWQGGSLDLVLAIPSSVDLLVSNAKEWLREVAEQSAGGKFCFDGQNKRKRTSITKERKKKQAVANECTKNELLTGWSSIFSRPKRRCPNSVNSLRVIRIGGARRCKKNEKSGNVDNERLSSSVEMRWTERLLDNILKMRNDYLKTHAENFGLFKIYLPTDDIEAASKRLNDIIEEAYDRLVKSRSTPDDIPFRNHPLFEDLSLPYVKSYVDQIKRPAAGPCELIH